MLFRSGTGFNANVRGILIRPDNSLIVVGNFTTFDSSTKGRIVGLTSNGQLNTNFNTGSGFNNLTLSVRAHPSGNIVVGGNFTTYKGVNTYRMTMLDNSANTVPSFSIGTGFDAAVFDIKVHDDGKIVAVGNFNNFNGQPCSKMARLNADGTLDCSFGVFNADLRNVTITSNNKYVVSGLFVTHNDVSVGSIIAFNYDGTVYSKFNTNKGFNARTIVTRAQSTGKIVVGGQFVSFNDVSTNYITRLRMDGVIDR